MADIDDYAVWMGIIFVMSVIIGATLNLPLLIIALFGIVAVVLTAVISSVKT